MSVILNLQEMFIPLRPIQRETLFVVVCINWATRRNWQTKLLHSRKVTQLSLLRQESVTYLPNNAPAPASVATASVTAAVVVCKVGPGGAHDTDGGSDGRYIRISGDDNGGGGNVRDGCSVGEDVVVVM